MQLTEHEVPGGVEQGSLPQYLLGCIFKALFMNESTLILRYKQKLFMAGTFVLICGMFVIIVELHPRAKRARGRSPIAKEIW